ncbi:kinase [Thraustotheca clavata]|uniref:Kinase n=1 Tax=Thraustotheca clavata TaxID=74557 RepID=A0A1V9Z0S5_9STRA|nr:kinase [Thraustotheca clavata]
MTCCPWFRYLFPSSQSKEFIVPSPAVQPKLHTPTTTSESFPDRDIDWSQYNALIPYKDLYWVDPDEISIIRNIPSEYMSACVANCQGELVLIHSLDKKKVKDDFESARKMLIAETLSMSKLTHPNIVKFVGFNITSESGLQCISEYIDGRTLRQVLDDPRQSKKLTWPEQKIDIAIGIISALAYMHSLKPAIIHRNIQASSIRLTSNLEPKLSGFGVSRARTYEDDMTAGVGDFRWAAPELLLEAMYDEKIDVYSFGVLLVELDTCAWPFAEEFGKMSKAELQNELITGVTRPKLSAECPKVIVKIVKRCLQQDANLRPRSIELLKLLNDAKLELKQE